MRGLPSEKGGEAMREIKLELRYPESRQEDITDAYMRGVEFGMASNNLKEENATLRELVQDLYAEMVTYSRAPHYNRSVWKPKLEAMGIEVPE